MLSDRVKGFDGDIRDAMTEKAQAKLGDGVRVLDATALNDAFRAYCADGNITWYRSTLVSQLLKLGLKKKRIRLNAGGSLATAYFLDPREVEASLRKVLCDNQFRIGHDGDDE